jgi:fructokinase
MSILCLGEMLWDCIADQVADSPAQVTTWTKYPGGSPANVAIALTKLGTASSLIGCIGMDQLGDELVELLTHANVNRTGVQRSSAPTRQVEVLLSQTGDRCFYQFRGRSTLDVADTQDFADTQLQATELPVALFESAQFLVLGTLGLAGGETRGAIARALALAQQFGVAILLDVNWRPTFWQEPSLARPLIRELLPRVDFLKLAMEEAEWLLETTDPALIQAQFPQLKAVLVTAGEQGCHYCVTPFTGVTPFSATGESSRRCGFVPAFSVTVQDTTGAGDSFVAGFLHQLVNRGVAALDHPESLSEVLFYASAVGALTTTKLGAIAAQPTATEVTAFLASQKAAVDSAMLSDELAK